MIHQISLDEAKQAGGMHHRLSLLVGEWTGMTRTWFEPGELADESPMHGVIRPALDGRFVLHEYEGSLQGRPFQGLAIYGYNLSAEKFETAWIDSFHMDTAIMFSDGQKTETGFSVLGHYSIPGGPPWGWRTEIEIIDSDHIIITAYNIPPDGEEVKGVETTYTRRS